MALEVLRPLELVVHIPDPTSPDTTQNRYVFDRAITRINPDGTTSTNYIDLYKTGHFVNEAKQGLSGGDHRSPCPFPTKTGHGKRGTIAFDKALERAFHQGRGYITALPADEGRPPFLIVCDVGHTIGQDPESLAACFGRKNKKRTDQITVILATLMSLGHI